VIFPDLPSSELPPEQLIDQACKRFEGHLEAREARRWMEIKVKSNRPIGVAFVGDPHIDNNWLQLPTSQAGYFDPRKDRWPVRREHRRPYR